MNYSIMRTEIKRRTVEYTMYVAKDGTEFEKKKDCILHEKMLNGDIIECPECHGKGTVAEEYEYDNYHTGEPETMTIHPTCTKCNGRGYLEKTIVYQ